MIIKYLPIAIVVSALALFSCTKDSQETPAKTPHATANALPITGKWQQTKLVTYLLDTNGAKLYDTTYLQPFTNADYVQFNNDGSCVLSVDHYYYLNEPGMSIPTKIDPLTTSFNYAAAGSKFVLKSTFDGANPGGFSSTDTVSMPDAHTLLIHTVGTTLSWKLYISDSYYTNNSN